MLAEHATTFGTFGDPISDAENYIKFFLCDEGQKIVEESEFVPVR